MSVFAGKPTLMIKIVFMAWDKWNKLKFFKNSFPQGSQGPQRPKSYLDLFLTKKS